MSVEFRRKADGDRLSGDGDCDGDCDGEFEFEFDAEIEDERGRGGGSVARKSSNDNRSSTSAFDGDITTDDERDRLRLALRYGSCGVDWRSLPRKLRNVVSTCVNSETTRGETRGETGGDGALGIGERRRSNSPLAPLLGGGGISPLRMILRRCAQK